MLKEEYMHEMTRKKKELKEASKLVRELEKMECEQAACSFNDEEAQKKNHRIKLRKQCQNEWQARIKARELNTLLEKDQKTLHWNLI